MDKITTETFQSISHAALDDDVEVVVVENGLKNKIPKIKSFLMALDIIMNRWRGF